MQGVHDCGRALQSPGALLDDDHHHRRCEAGWQSVHRAGAAWQLAENQIIACVHSTCQLSLEVITNAMTLAPCHLKSAGEEPEAAPPPITTLSTGARRFKEIDSEEEKDASALQADIAKGQLALAVLQTKPGSGKQGGAGLSGGYVGGGCGGGRGGMSGSGHGGGAAGGGGRHPSHGPPMRACTICCMHHPGDPPEDHCYKSNVKVASEALDTLEAEQRAATARAKDRAEQK
eukprot:1697298-Rhodomonas_salina.2